LIYKPIGKLVAPHGAPRVLCLNVSTYYQHIAPLGLSFNFGILFFSIPHNKKALRFAESFFIMR